MTRQRFADLVRRTLAELRMEGYVLATVDVDQARGVLCFIISFDSPEKAKHIYLDIYDEDEDRVVREIKSQLLLDELGSRVKWRKFLQ